MKKYLYNLVIATLILISTTVVQASNEVYYTNKNNIEMTEKEYNNLLGLGFTERQIETMDNEIFLDNKDLEATFLEKQTKYELVTTNIRNGIKYTTRKEITKEEAIKEKEKQSQNQNGSKGPSGNYYDGVSYDYYIKQITTTITGLGDTLMRFKVDSEWITMPSARYYDIIGIGIESNKVSVASTLVFRENWLTTGNVEGYTTTCYPKTESTGGSAVFKLPTGSMQQLKSYLYFNVAKKSGVGTITELFASGDYAHATSSLNPNNILSNYTINYGSGLIISSAYSNYFDNMSIAVASFVGTW